MVRNDHYNTKLEKGANDNTPWVRTFDHLMYMMKLHQNKIEEICKILMQSKLLAVEISIKRQSCTIFNDF